MSDTTQYMIKDAGGNVYGPATIATLRDWYREGRVLAAMQIAPVGTTSWQSMASHPGLADLFGPAPRAPAPAAAPAAARPFTPIATATPAAQPASGAASPAFQAASPASSASFFAQVKADAPLALWGAIVSGAGVVLCCGCGWILGVAGAIMGFIALSQIKPTADPRVRQAAYAAIALGVVAIITNCCGFVGLYYLNNH